MKIQTQKYNTFHTIVSINLGNFGSTGTIVYGIANLARENGYKYYCAYPEQADNIHIQKDDIILCSDLTRRINQKLSYITGFNGCFAILTTLKFLFKLNRIKPSILHFHNLHNSYINLPMLFSYIKRKKINVIWTLHDVWSFTGQCPHFIMVKCEKWKTGCYDCPQYDIYPASKVDKTKQMWKLKRNCFNGVDNMLIVTPSKWLANLVKQSFLKDYQIKVINNGIDLKIFKPTTSSFREKWGGKKYFILGVSFDWGKRKGIDVFIELSKQLDNEYCIVLVGTNSELDKILPKNIISIHRTMNQKELAKIYTTADVFVNPTREEVLGMVNIEALACGTPVITFKTGGSPECIDINCGEVCDVDDLENLRKMIIKICTEKPYTKSQCISRARKFLMSDKYMEYLHEYKRIMNIR